VAAAIIMPAVNTEAMNEHLKEISTQVAAGAHAVVVLDGAGWHQRGAGLRVPDNITLLSLPPYAAELNPMENVWEYLRGNKLCAVVWGTYDAIVEGCREAWSFLTDDPDRIRSIGTRQWHRSVVRPVGISYRSARVARESDGHDRPKCDVQHRRAHCTPIERRPLAIGFPGRS
jgi:hypothetical protein